MSRKPTFGVVGAGGGGGRHGGQHGDRQHPYRVPARAVDPSGECLAQRVVELFAHGRDVLR